MTYAIDTSFLSKDEVEAGALGLKIVKNAKQLILTGHKFITCESIFKEINNFVCSCASKDELEVINQLITIDYANLYTAKIPAILVAELIGSQRERSQSFLKNVENIIKEESEASIKIGKIRRHHREKYKRGILDSAADLELALLARKKKCVVLTRDEGLSRICHKLGVKTSDKL